MTDAALKARRERLRNLLSTAQCALTSGMHRPIDRCALARVVDDCNEVVLGVVDVLGDAAKEPEELAS